MINSNSIYDNRLYIPVAPVADTEELAVEVDRLILYHSLNGTTLSWVTDRYPVAGWVVGISLPIK